MTWRLFDTTPERTETREAIGLNWARLNSTQPQTLTYLQAMAQWQSPLLETLRTELNSIAVRLPPP
jgi:hypothetical protein